MWYNGGEKKDTHNSQIYLNIVTQPHREEAYVYVCVQNVWQEERLGEKEMYIFIFHSMESVHNI